MVTGRRGVGQHIFVDGDGALIVAQSDGRGGSQCPVVAVLRIQRQQGVDLHRRQDVFLALDQGFRIVVARRPVVGLQHQDGFEQGFGVVQDIASQADARQQTHGLRMVAGLQQEGADDVLGRFKVAVGEQSGRRHHFGR